MPVLSWNEIRARSIEFANEYANATRENAETQSFYNDFFNVFGITRRRVASFEEPVKKLADKKGRIDLFWKGTLLIEQKSSGRDLDEAYTQAINYFPNLKEEELPKYILVSDFQRFELYDLETGSVHKFLLSELHKNVEHFGFIAGYRKREFKDQDPVNIEASEKMGVLHDLLKDAGYGGHELELYLVRLLFCLFAEDTGIFERDALRFYIEEKTKEDGSDLGMHLASIFQVLNIPKDKRNTLLDESVNAFPYINGSLFAGNLPIASFNSEMRNSLISACYFDWSRISPAIFGSLFQSVMDKDRRRGVGAHYTTEKNIMKILKPLFLDELYAEFNKIKNDKKRLEVFHVKLSKLTFFDPACGCGNFLILAYRELRLLEIELLKALYGDKQQVLDVTQLSRIDVDAFYGIEIEEFPAKIAEVALWLMDHQMNMRLSEAFGVYYARLPLKKSPHIHHANAHHVSWQDIVPPEKLSYILGNPPFIGYKYQSDWQRADMEKIFHGIKGAGVLDYVSAWYFQAAKYIHKTTIKVAFVSTNSITQGEQAGVLWKELMGRYNIKIYFAHRTFAWGSEARGKAMVHCVIIGFASFDVPQKFLYDYETPKSEEPHETKVNNINPYLVDSATIFVDKRRTPICTSPEMDYGSEPREGGFLIVSDDEKEILETNYPFTKKWIKRFVSADDYINNLSRWCLWLVKALPEEIKKCPPILDRLKEVTKFRKNSLQKSALKASESPHLFVSIRQPKNKYLLIPIVSSERRKYIPIGYVDSDIIVSNACFTIPNATIYHFGILTSAMHMDWMRQVCGRLESRYRYSNTIVYNNFPWPTPTPAQIAKIEEKAKAVLDARAEFPSSTLADLYDPLVMPQKLLKAHQALDKEVDKSYKKEGFANERNRIEHLFELYQKLDQPLLPTQKIIKKRNKK